MPEFRFDKISDIAQGVKAILNPEGVPSGAAGRAVEQREDQAEDSKNASQDTSERWKTRRKRQELARAQRGKIKSKKRELSRLRELGDATDEAERSERKREKKRLLREIFELERKLRAVKERRAEDKEPVTGALPDFLVIGAMKGGTSFFYHLLTQHPLVEPCAKKELHFFDHLFDEGIEWYSHCFPAPRWKDGRKTITGEATPYLDQPSAPKKIAQVVPQARLIALLRHPVDRAYSDYQHLVRKDREHKTFEEAVGLQKPSEAKKVQPLSKEGENSEGEGGADLNSDSEYLLRSVYVDQLLRWSEYFPREQLLVLKSEDFFEHPKAILKAVFDFLDLPEWELQVLETRKEPKKRDKRNKGTYEEMDPATRRRLEGYFEPHNKRLYDYLGSDFGW